MRFVVPLLTQSVRRGALPMLRAATDPAVRGREFYGPRFVAAGSPRLQAPAPGGRDAELAEGLWEASADLTGLPAGV